MADQLQAVVDLATGALGAGEVVQAAALVSYGGKVNANQAPPGLAALGHADTQLSAGEALVARYGERPDVSFPSAKQMALVLTDRRVLVWSRGLAGRPKAFLGEVPVDTIAEVAGGGSGDRRLTVHMRSGWEIHLEVTRDGGQPFGDALRYAVGAAEPGP